MGLDLPGLYIRFRVIHREDDIIEVFPFVYPSREAFDESPLDRRSPIALPELEYFQFRDYKRSLKGTDVLNYVHAKVVEILTTEEKEEEILTRRKFVEPADITIIELNTEKK